MSEARGINAPRTFLYDMFIQTSARQSASNQNTPSYHGVFGAFSKEEARSEGSLLSESGSLTESGSLLIGGKRRGRGVCRSVPSGP